MPTTYNIISIIHKNATQRVLVLFLPTGIQDQFLLRRCYAGTAPFCPWTDFSRHDDVEIKPSIKCHLLNNNCVCGSFRLMVFLFRYFALGLLYHYNGQDAAALQVFMHVHGKPYSFSGQIQTRA